jgi:phosphoribosylformylglycinamidine cyclo-ligase
VSDSYRAAGVDYASLDAGKRRALSAALATSGLMAARGGQAVDESRGEPAFVFEFGGRTLAFVLEGLGTKSVIARQVIEAGGANRFADVAIDTVAAIVNDLCCVGALPLVVNAYFATGRSDWYDDEERAGALLDGWRHGCELAGCTWGGGESPTLPGVVAEADIELAGSAVGAVPEGRRPLLGDALAPGDEIVLVESSGLHANGASLARQVAAALPEGYATGLPGGETLGDALLAPSVIYTPLVAALLDAAVPVSYLSHITGHGLTKLMRPPAALTYRIRRLPAVPPVLEFLAAQSGMGAEEAYRTFNMGCGFAVYTAAGTGAAVVEAAERLGFAAGVAGTVEEGPRQVILEPVGVRYASEQLRLAPE